MLPFIDRFGSVTDLARGIKALYQECIIATASAMICPWSKASEGSWLPGNHRAFRIYNQTTSLR